MQLFTLIVILTVAAGISCEGGRIKGKKDGPHKGKWNKGAMLTRECLKPEVADAQLTLFNQSMGECFMIFMNSTGELKPGFHMDKEVMKKVHKLHKEKGMCMMACKWGKLNLLSVAKNGTAAMNETAFAEFTAKLTDDAAKAFTMQMNVCAEKKGLSMNPTLGENCKGLKKHKECWARSMDVACDPAKRASALNGQLDLDVPNTTGSPGGDDDDMEMGMLTTSAPVI